MTKPKQQHWVPRFYLKYFATPETRETAEPQVWILSKDEGDPALANVKKVATRRYLYSPRDSNGDRAWHLDEDFADYEAVVGTICVGSAPCSIPLLKRQTRVMLEIVKDGLIESDDQLSALVQSHEQVVIPNEDENLDLTHWWIIRDDGVEALYVGTDETFATYVKERNGGLQ
jgi:hypothetical protein